MNPDSSAEIFRGQFAGPRDRARLSTQMNRIRAYALARDWFTLREASLELERLYTMPFPEGSLAAQLRHLEKAGAGKLRCKKEKRHRGGGLWQYRLRALPAEISVQPARLESDEPMEKVRFPATLQQLEAAGYDFMGPAKECSCGVQFVWWITPAGKWIPLSTLNDSRLIPHRAVCANAKQFREANARHEARANPQPLQAALF